MSRRLPDWVATATEPSRAEVSRLLDGPEELARLGAEATEPLADEVASLLRRRTAPAPLSRPRWLGAPWLGSGWTPLLGLALLALLVVLASGRLEIAGISRISLARSAGHSASAALASYMAQGAGTWTQRVRDPRGVLIEQLEGVIRYQVDPLPAGQRFRVRARSVEVEVVGTIFDVGIEGSSVWVEVLEGRVSVRDGAVHTVLEPGDRWGVERPVAEAPGLLAPTRTSDDRRGAPEPAALAAPSERSPQGAAAQGPAGGHAQADSLLTDVALQGGDELVGGSKQAGPRSPRKARAYSSLLGRVEGGERSEALVAELEAFASQAEGPLADLALVTAIEVAAQVRPPRVVIDTIDWFLVTHPRDANRRFLLELRGDLARDGLQDCELALPSYRELAGASSGAQQARAEALRGLCAASVGRVNEARTALLSSLQLGIDLPLRSEVHAALDALE